MSVTIVHREKGKMEEKTRTNHIFDINIMTSFFNKLMRSFYITRFTTFVELRTYVDGERNFKKTIEREYIYIYIYSTEERDALHEFEQKTYPCRHYKVHALTYTLEKDSCRENK